MNMPETTTLVEPITLTETAAAAVATAHPASLPDYAFGIRL
jgi:hypothetical protein